VAHGEVGLGVHVGVEETLGWHAELLAGAVLHREVEFQVGHLLSNLGAGLVEVAPIEVCAGHRLVRIRANHVVLEGGESVFRHADEGKSRVDEGSCMVLEVLFVEADVFELNLPSGVVERLEPDLLVSLLKELFVISSETNG